jgi:Protein of unknown function (DUF4007)
MSSDTQPTQVQALFEDKQPSQISPPVQNLPHPQAAFSRHETFHPRFGWIKKGFDRTCLDGKIFLEDDATTTLGVGKNMVRSIRYWCIAFKVLEEVQEKGGRARELHPTAFGTKLLADDGWDPYLEDPGSLWLLHWYLFKPSCIATTWYFTFACFQRVEFSFESLFFLLKDYVQCQFPKNNVADSSLQKDISCLTHMYVPLKARDNAIEDMLDSPFATIGLIQPESDGKHFSFHVGYKSTLPSEIIVAACLEFADSIGKGERTISISRLMYEEGSPGVLFKLTESVLCNAIEQISQKDHRVYLSDSSGLIQIAFTQPPAILAESILDHYYNNEW